MVGQACRIRVAVRLCRCCRGLPSRSIDRPCRTGMLGLVGVLRLYQLSLNHCVVPGGIGTYCFEEAIVGVRLLGFFVCIGRRVGIRVMSNNRDHERLRGVGLVEPALDLAAKVLTSTPSTLMFYHSNMCCLLLYWPAAEHCMVKTIVLSYQNTQHVSLTSHNPITRRPPPQNSYHCIDARG